MERWRSALASGQTSLLSPTEQERYGQLYGLFERYDQHEAHEQQIWADLPTETNVPVCLPIDLSRADALRQLNAPLGEP